MALEAPAAPATPAAPAPAAPATPAPVKTTETTPKAPDTNPGGSKPPENLPKDPGSAPKAPEPGAETPPDPSKPHKLTVSGKDVWLSDAELREWAQRGQGAHQKFEEAAKLRKQNEQLTQLFKENPKLVMDKLGLDAFKFAEELLMQKINLEKMTPEQRELHETREKLREMETQKQESERLANEARHQQLVQQHNENYAKDITTTLDSSGLPKTEFTVKRMAYYMAEGLKRGVALKAADVAPLVREDYQRDFQLFFNGTNAETIAQLMGDTTIKKLMEFQAAKLRPPETPPAPNTVTVPANGSEVPKLGKDDWREMMEKNFGR